MIYLDNAATTKVFDCAIDCANEVMRLGYFNPNTTYKNSVAAKNEVEQARAKLAKAVGVAADEIVFTSCATESNNWVFECACKNKKGNVVISSGEHSSVYEPAMRLKNRGVDVRVVPLNRDGTIDLGALEGSLDANTTLVSIIHVSNETGAVNDIKTISRIVKSKSPRALLHSDGVQAILKTGEGIDGLGVDLYSASAHKIGGPKGIGFLYIKHGLTIAPLICGGGQEGGLRSGTQNTPYIAAFAAAAEHYKSINSRERISKISDEIARIFTDADCKIVTQGGSGYILCVCMNGVKAEILQNAVCDKGIIIGKGAACSGSKRGNRVLSAMGLTPAEIECCIRISLSADSDFEQSVSAAHTIIQTAKQIRSGNVG